MEGQGSKIKIVGQWGDLRFVVEPAKFGGGYCLYRQNSSNFERYLVGEYMSEGAAIYAGRVELKMLARQYPDRTGTVKFV